MKAKTKSIPVTKDKTDITLKQKTFIITKRAAGVPIKEIQEQWKSHFERTPPECRTIIRIYQKAISENSIESKKCNSGRKRTVRTKEIIAEVKEVLDSQNDAQPQHNVNRGRSNQWGIKRGSWANIMKDIGYIPYRVRRHQELSPLNEERRLEFCQLMKKKSEDFFLRTRRPGQPSSLYSRQDSISCIHLQVFPMFLKTLEPC